GKDERLYFAAPGLNLPVPQSRAKALAAYKDRPITMGIRPEDMHEAHAQDSPANVFEAHVEVVEPIGHEIYLDVTAGGTEIVARVSPDTPVKMGQTIKLAASVDKLHAFDPQTEKAIRAN
ncbi:MAG TPA: TOBE domain-containing protein, partial [Candidatus Sulfotelmatobacter sp.]|nr:TOBE domain-containing protein [Candidatus Sulfotelmatobacter sp.]